MQRNLYHGINAHLHSRLQAEGGWKGFHTAHIARLAADMRAHLLPMSYTATIASSLQLHVMPMRPVADIAIYDAQQRPDPPASATPGALAIPITHALDMPADDKQDYAALVIRQRDDPTPLVWIELLSPSNKPGGGPAAAQYRDKRTALLLEGIALLELDYLHESPPTFHGVALYPHEAGSHPYRIALFIPRPDAWAGQVTVHEFDVDEPLPTATIPLKGEDRLAFDFDASYQRQYEEQLYGLESVNYSQPPVNLDRYSAADRERLQAVQRRAEM
jgi:hypothetical protein